MINNNKSVVLMWSCIVKELDDHFQFLEEETRNNELSKECAVLEVWLKQRHEILWKEELLKQIDEILRLKEEWLLYAKQDPG